MPSNDAPATVETVYVDAAYDHLTGRFFAVTGDDDRKTIHQSPLIDDLLSKITAALSAEHDGDEIIVYLSGRIGFSAFSGQSREKPRCAVVTARDLAVMFPKPDPRFNPAAAAVFAAGYFAALNDLKAAKNL